MAKGFKGRLLLCLAAVIAAHGTAAAVEIGGWMEAEGRYFFQEPLYPAQDWNSASLAVRPEFYREWAGGHSFTFVPFYRYDSADDQRTRFDVREALFLWPAERYELRAGIGKVFWGVTEGRHLVDIVNQSDTVESIDGEEKLGQPMVNLTLLSDFGTLDLFVLPYFRERTFPGRNGRLRFDPYIDTGRDAVYEDDAKARRVDYALRYSHTLGGWDVGVSQFYGTTREPAFLVRPGATGNLIIDPFYEIISQTGLDLQYVSGAWMWKLEAIYRSGHEDGSYYATDAGLEYTFSGPRLRGMDLGLILEYMYDSREFDVELSELIGGGYIGSRFNTFLNNDFMAGLRFAFNDTASSEILAGFIQDLDNRSAVFQLEASRRLGDSFKLELNTYFFLNAENDPLMNFLRKDSFMQMALKYYF